jgi:hypothetical protein
MVSAIQWMSPGFELAYFAFSGASQHTIAGADICSAEEMLRCKERDAKVVVGIVRDEGLVPDPLERWFSEETDVRNNPSVGERVVAFLKEHAAKSVIVTEGLIGCPHEEGIDYPRENPARSAPTGPGETASRASASSETRTPTCVYS